MHHCKHRNVIPTIIVGHDQNAWDQVESGLHAEELVFEFLFQVSAAHHHDGGNV